MKRKLFAKLTNFNRLAEKYPIIKSSSKIKSERVSSCPRSDCLCFVLLGNYRNKLRRVNSGQFAASKISLDCRIF